MRIEPATPDDLPAIRAAYEHGRITQREQGSSAFYARRGFRLVGHRRIGFDPRLPPHYHGGEFALLEQVGDSVAEG